MKRKASLTLNIPHPCTQSWNEMPPADNGRFCLHCQKTVIDFSDMSDQEILAALSTNEEHRCGRFLPEQLNRGLQERSQPRRSFLPAALLTSLIAAIIPDNTEAKDLADTTVQSVTPKIDSLVKQNPPGIFTGEIVNAVTGDSLPGVTIMLKDDNTRDLGTVTDQQGQFRFNIPDRSLCRPLTFEIRCVGYDTKEICFDIEQLSLPAKIGLQRLNVDLKEITVNGYAVTTRSFLVGGLIATRRPNLWQRVKHFFRRIGHHHANCVHH